VLSRRRFWPDECSGYKLMDCKVLGAVVPPQADCKIPIAVPMLLQHTSGVRIRPSRLGFDYSIKASDVPLIGHLVQPLIANYGTPFFTGSIHC
jgi:hypothetical protein